MTTVKSITAYAQVAGQLRQQILTGDLSPGQKLHPEREMCEQFGASRITIRRALQILEDEQLIQRQQGRGTFVSPRPTRKIPILHTDYVSSIAEHAPEIEREVDEWGWREAGNDIASVLQLLPHTKVLFARRFDIIEGQPVNYDELYICESAAHQLTQEDLAQIEFVPIWIQKHQITIKYSTQRIEAIAANPLEAKRLNIKVAAPLLKCIDIMYITTGEPIAVFISFYRHDMFHMTATISKTFMEDQK